MGLDYNINYNGGRPDAIILQCAHAGDRHPLRPSYSNLRDTLLPALLQTAEAVHHQADTLDYVLDILLTAALALASALFLPLQLRNPHNRNPADGAPPHRGGITDIQFPCDKSFDNDTTDRREKQGQGAP